MKRCWSSLSDSEEHWAAQRCRPPLDPPVLLLVIITRSRLQVSPLRVNMEISGGASELKLCATRTPPSLLYEREARAGGGSIVTGPIGAPRGGGAVRGPCPREKPRRRKGSAGAEAARAGDALEAGRRRRQRWRTLWPLRASARRVRGVRGAAYPRRDAASRRGRGAAARRPARASRRESGARLGRANPFARPPEKRRLRNPHAPVSLA